jgi:hypothetical protein
MKELQEELVQLQSSVIAQNVSLVCAFAVSLLGVKSRPDSGILVCLQVVIDSIAALARKEGFNERDKEEFFIAQVRHARGIAGAY